MRYHFYVSDGAGGVGSLVPVWNSLTKENQGGDYTATPSISGEGNGWYFFDYSDTFTLIGEIDATATISDANRYIAVKVSPNDDYVDAPISDTALEATSLSLSAEIVTKPTLSQIEASTILAKEGADNDTLETLSNQIDLLQGDLDSMVALDAVSGTLSADTTEQNIYINDAPSQEWIADSLNIDTIEMQAGDIIVIKTFVRLKSGGTYREQDSVTLTGVQPFPAILIKGYPNRYGYKVTLQQTAGTNRDFDWQRFTAELVP